MDFIKKLSISFVAIGLITSSSHANVDESVRDVAIVAIENAAKVAMKDVTYTRLQNLIIDSEIHLNESAVIGDVGSHISGDNIDASNSKITSRVRMNRSFVFGKVGSSAGS